MNILQFEGRSIPALLTQDELLHLSHKPLSLEHISQIVLCPTQRIPSLVHQSSLRPSTYLEYTSNSFLGFFTFWDCLGAKFLSCPERQFYRAHLDADDLIMIAYEAFDWAATTSRFRVPHPVLLDCIDEHWPIVGSGSFSSRQRRMVAEAIFKQSDAAFCRFGTLAHAVAETEYTPFSVFVGSYDTPLGSGPIDLPRSS